MTDHPDEHEGKEPPLEEAVERLQHAEQDLNKPRADDAEAEHDIEEAVEDIEHAEHRKDGYELIVNRKPHRWPHRRIDGREIKVLAGSPADWVVNQIVDGPGQDPEVADDEKVDLALDAPPKGIKKFTTRKPKTSPGCP